MTRHLSLRLPVAECPPLEDNFSVAGGLWLPDPLPDHPILLCCLPGGGMNHRYFDLRAGDGDDSFSFAQAMTRRGYVVAALDHPGTGQSRTMLDRFHLTPRLLAQAYAAAVRTLISQLRDGWLQAEVPAMPDLRSVGVAHSMGAMVMILAQAASRLHDGLALLGFSTRGLPEYLPPDIAARFDASMPVDDAQLVSCARAVFGKPKESSDGHAAGRASLFGTRHADPRGLGALRDAMDGLLHSGALQAMLPGNVQLAASQILVPVLTVVGDDDMTGPAEPIPDAFSASVDSRLQVLTQTGHCHFVFPSRDSLWTELDRWSAALTRTTPK